MTVQLMTADDLARLLRKSPRWVEREASKGRIPSIKIGRDRRFTDAHFAEYIEGLDTARSESPSGNPWGRKTRS